MTRLRDRLNPFYSPIPFSITAEDSAVVESALKVGPGDRVVSVGSAGDTPLNLLRCDPRGVSAVDLSFPQICEIALKVEAMRRFDLEDVHTLLGITPDSSRAVRLYERLRCFLDPAVAAFWDRHSSLLTKGLLWQGGIQRMVRAGRKALCLLLGRARIERLKELSDQESVERYWHALSRSWRFRAVAALVGNRFVLGSFYPATGFGSLPPGVTPGEYLLDRLRGILLSRPLGSHPQLTPFLFDEYPSPDSLPPYLHPGDFSTISSRLDRLRWIHADLPGFLGGLPPDSVDAFALLNVTDWMDEPEAHGLLEQVARSGRRGARLLTYSRSRPLALPPTLRRKLALEKQLSERLSREDRIGYYRFTYVFRIVG